MTTERYFAGNKLASFFRTIPGHVESTTAGTFDSTFVSNSIFCNSGGEGEYIQTASFQDASSATTFWLHFEYHTGGFPNGNGARINFVNSTGTVVARLYHMVTGTQGDKFQYWNGSAFVDYGSIFPVSTGVLYRIDMKIVCGASGTIDIWKAGTLATSASSGMNAAMDNIAAVQFTAYASTRWSQMFGLNFDTRDLRLIEPAINANGTHTDGSGTYTDINETPLDESTAILLPAVNDMKTFTKAAITIPSGYIIDSAWVNARERVTGGTVTDADHVFRSGGTDYPSSGRAPAAAYEPRMYYSATDPATGVAWTQSGYNNAEVGIKAV